jgi:hypothetical protein
MPRITRAIVTGFGAVLALLSIPTPALAKIPPFTVEWSPQAPAVGEEVTFTVRFWDDVAHTDRAGWVEQEWLDDILRVFPASGSSADDIDLELERVKRGVFRGRVAFPTPGPWSVCIWDTSCPVGKDVNGYPGRLELTVAGDATPPVAANVALPRSAARDVAAGPAEERSASSSAPAAAVVALALAGLLVGVLRAVARSPKRSATRSR